MSRLQYYLLLLYVRAWDSYDVIREQLRIYQLISNRELGSDVESQDNILGLIMIYLYYVETIRSFPVNFLLVNLPGR